MPLQITNFLTKTHITASLLESDLASAYTRLFDFETVLWAARGSITQTAFTFSKRFEKLTKLLTSTTYHLRLVLKVQ